MKVKIGELAKQFNVSIEELFKFRDEKLLPEQWTGTGKNTYFTEKAVEQFELSREVPLAVPSILDAYVIHEARNPRWVYAKIANMDGKKPVAIPHRLKGFLINKMIKVEAIKDANGEITYRHCSLRD